MMINKLSDAELVTLYVQGNEYAFSILLKRHQSKVLTTIYLIVKDKEHAEDLMQDTFFKVINKLKAGQYKQQDKFVYWVCRIARNMAIDSFRSKKRNPMLDIDEIPTLLNSTNFSENSFVNHKIKEDQYALLLKYIVKLPDPQKEVLMLRHYGEMNFQEIAAETGVSINTALGRMRYAILNLRKQFEKEPIAYDENYYPE